MHPCRVAYSLPSGVQAAGDAAEQVVDEEAGRSRVHEVDLHPANRLLAKITISKNVSAAAHCPPPPPCFLMTLRGAWGVEACHCIRDQKSGADLRVEAGGEADDDAHAQHQRCIAAVDGHLHDAVGDSFGRALMDRQPREVNFRMQSPFHAGAAR